MKLLYDPNDEAFRVAWITGVSCAGVLFVFFSLVVLAKCFVDQRNNDDSKPKKLSIRSMSKRNLLPHSNSQQEYTDDMLRSFARKSLLLEAQRSGLNLTEADMEDV